jgi:hypothetical protein
MWISFFQFKQVLILPISFSGDDGVGISQSTDSMNALQGINCRA